MYLKSKYVFLYKENRRITIPIDTISTSAHIKQILAMKIISSSSAKQNYVVEMVNHFPLSFSIWRFKKKYFPSIWRNQLQLRYFCHPSASFVCPFTKAEAIRPVARTRKCIEMSIKIRTDFLFLRNYLATLQMYIKLCVCTERSFKLNKGTTVPTFPSL